MNSINEVTQLLDDLGFEVRDTTTLPARVANYKKIPNGLNTTIQELLKKKYPNGIFSHQASALQLLMEGNDICLSTPTASGKSLVFMAGVSHLLLENTGRKALALYPHKALIQDQMSKWIPFAHELGLRVGYIDGDVPRAQRPEILNKSDILVATPDVVHAWLLSQLQEKEIFEFVRRLHYLILDEAHIYEGVFGSNMAFFIRRLIAVSKITQIITSTATLGKPENYIQLLTGRDPVTIEPDKDGSSKSVMDVFLVSSTLKDSYAAKVSLLKALAKSEAGRFIAFADSRKMVEQVVSAIHRRDDDETEEQDDSIESESEIFDVLPYRAGYEVVDRNNIQQALSDGTLSGVVSTSAMEMGLDIGEISTVVLLSTPNTVTSFWQRIGRAGRKQAGISIIIDQEKAITSLPQYMQKPLEAKWIYLDNRYIQYTNALCAATELNLVGGSTEINSAFNSLPDQFRRMLENEILQTETVPPDLYVLKQRAQNGAHIEFPVRTLIEKEFKIRLFQQPLGSLSYTQVLREAYPGAIYFYMAKPHRVQTFSYRKGEINVVKSKRWSTKPIVQTMVFPRIPTGILSLLRSETSFAAEVELQVSERVLGFQERRGSTNLKETYGPASQYYQRSLDRFFESTGVCWYFGDPFLDSLEFGEMLCEVFCDTKNIQAHDIGVGVYYSRSNPLGLSECRGCCIFDATHGSLRLTQKLAEDFISIATETLALEPERNCSDSLANLQAVDVINGDTDPCGDDTVIVIAPGQRAMRVDQSTTREVLITDFRYTPNGVVYFIDNPAGRETLRANHVQAIFGISKMMKVNLLTDKRETIE